MQQTKTTLTKPSDLELVFTRIFDAPRDLVFKAWTEPEHVVKWWGPNGFSTTSLEMNVKPGGTWRLVMHGPDGTDYKNRIVYMEVVKPERLVYRHVGEEGEGEEQVQMHVVVTFEAIGKQTKVSMQMVFGSAEERTRVIEKYGADKGAVETLQRLADYLDGIN